MFVAWYSVFCSCGYKRPLSCRILFGSMCVSFCVFCSNRTEKQQMAPGTGPFCVHMCVLHADASWSGASKL